MLFRSFEEIPIGPVRNSILYSVLAIPNGPKDPVRSLHEHDAEFLGVNVSKIMRCSVCKPSSLHHDDIAIGRFEQALYQVTGYTKIFGSC